MSISDPKEGRTGSFAVTPCDVQLLASNPAATVAPDGTRLAVGHGLDRDGERLLREAMHRRSGEAGTRRMTRELPVRCVTAGLRSTAVPGGL